MHDYQEGKMRAWRGGGAVKNIIILPSWCLETNRKNSEEGKGGRMILSSVSSICNRWKQKRHRCEKHIFCVYTAFIPGQCHRQHSRSRLSLVFCTPPRTSQWGQRQSERRAPDLLSSSLGPRLDPRPRLHGVRLLYQCPFPGPLFPD